MYTHPRTDTHSHAPFALCPDIPLLSCTDFYFFFFLLDLPRWSLWTHSHSRHTDPPVQARHDRPRQKGTRGTAEPHAHRQQAAHSRAPRQHTGRGRADAPAPKQPPLPARPAAGAGPHTPRGDPGTCPAGAEGTHAPRFPGDPREGQGETGCRAGTGTKPRAGGAGAAWARPGRGFFRTYGDRCGGPVCGPFYERPGGGGSGAGGGISPCKRRDVSAQDTGGHAWPWPGGMRGSRRTRGGEGFCRRWWGGKVPPSLAGGTPGPHRPRPAPSPPPRGGLSPVAPSGHPAPPGPVPHGGIAWLMDVWRSPPQPPSDPQASAQHRPGPEPHDRRRAPPPAPAAAPRGRGGHSPGPRLDPPGLSQAALPPGGQ